MRVAVFTYFDDKFRPLADVTLPVLQDYCLRRGYKLYSHDLGATFGSLKAGFIKTRCVRDMLFYYDVVMAMDIDTLVTNFGIRVEDFIEKDYDIYLSKDVNNINLGVFIVKSTPFTKGVLEFVATQHITYGDEQNVFEKNWFDFTKICKHPCFNSIPYQHYAPSYGYIEWEKMKTPPSLPTHEQGCWQPGDFIMHLPGMPLERRIEIFTETLKNISYD